MAAAKARGVVPASTKPSFWDALVMAAQARSGVQRPTHQARPPMMAAPTKTAAASPSSRLCQGKELPLMTPGPALVLADVALVDSPPEDDDEFVVDGVSLVETESLGVGVFWISPVPPGVGSKLTQPASWK